MERPVHGVAQGRAGRFASGLGVLDVMKRTARQGGGAEAVRAGGGANHRFGLDDAVLIKDNHLAVAGGIAVAVTRVRDRLGHMVKIEVEVDTLDQLDELLTLGVDAVLLDNMSPALLAEAVGGVDGRMMTEASGGITPETVAAGAASGVDLISLGWLTHSVTNLDVALDFEAS